MSVIPDVVSSRKGVVKALLGVSHSTKKNHEFGLRPCLPRQQRLVMH